MYFFGMAFVFILLWFLLIPHLPHFDSLKKTTSSDWHVFTCADKIKLKINLVRTKHATHDIVRFHKIFLIKVRHILARKFKYFVVSPDTRTAPTCVRSKRLRSKDFKQSNGKTLKRHSQCLKITRKMSHLWALSIIKVECRCTYTMFENPSKCRTFK